jgi:hypothetical protein
MEKISWTDHVRNEEVLLRVKEQRNILHEICKRKANWIGHILRRNCLLQRVTEGKINEGIEVTRRRGRRRRKLLDDFKERRGYPHLKEEALDRTMRRARYGRGFGPVVRQTTKWMNELIWCLTLQSWLITRIPNKTVCSVPFIKQFYVSECRMNVAVVWHVMLCRRDIVFRHSFETSVCMRRHIAKDRNLLL